MDAPKSYTIRTETGELRLMSQEEVGALVRSTMEKAKATSPSPKSPGSATSPRPRNPYTSTSQRLSRTPKRGARKFHFRLTPEAKKTNDKNQAAFATESTSNSSKETDLECRSERPSARSYNASQRCQSGCDGMEAHEKPVSPETGKDCGHDKTKVDKGETATKKNLSEVEIGDLVRNSIRRARENAKEKTPQQLALAKKAAFAINEITTSPVSKQELTWTSTEEQETCNEDDVPSDKKVEEPPVSGSDSTQPVFENAIERTSTVAISAAISKTNSIVEADDQNEDQLQMPSSPANQPSVVSEAQSQISRAFRSFFHGHFRSHEQEDAERELLNAQIAFGKKSKQGMKQQTAQDHLRVDIPSYSDVRDEQPSLNRIVQETMRRARETAEESVLECAPFSDPCEAVKEADASVYSSKENPEVHYRASTKTTEDDISGTSECSIDKLGTHDSYGDDIISATDTGEEFNEKVISEALDISDVDSEVEDLSYQRSMQTSYGPLGGCCGVHSVLSPTTQAKTKEIEPTESTVEMKTNHDDEDEFENSFNHNMLDSKASEDHKTKCSVDPPEGESVPEPHGPTLEEVVIKLMKSETTTEAEAAGLGNCFTKSISDPTEGERLPDPTVDDIKPNDNPTGSRLLLKLKVSCSSDEDYPSAREVRQSLSASLHSTSRSMHRTRSVSDFNGAHRRAQTLSSRSRRYRRSVRKSREQPPKAQITEEFLADLAKRKGKKITIDEIKRMLNVPDAGSDEESVTAEVPTEPDDVSLTPNQLQPRVPDTTAISTHFCVDIWDLFQPMDDLRRVSDDDYGPLEDFQSAVDLESAAEDTTSEETTTFCDTDADAQPNPRMTFSFSQRGASSSSDDSTIIGW